MLIVKEIHKEDAHFGRPGILGKEVTKFDLRQCRSLPEGWMSGSVDFLNGGSLYFYAVKIGKPEPSFIGVDLAGVEARVIAYLTNPCANIRLSHPLKNEYWVKLKPLWKLMEELPGHIKVTRLDKNNIPIKAVWYNKAYGEVSCFIREDELKLYGMNVKVKKTGRGRYAPVNHDGIWLDHRFFEFGPVPSEKVCQLGIPRLI